MIDKYFDVKKRLKNLYLHDNNITSIPYLKVVGHDHVLQEFSRSHYKRKIDKRKSTSGDTKKKLNELNTQLDGKAPVNISANGKTGENLDVHKTNMLRNSFILEEDEELLNDQSQQSLRQQHSTDASEKPMSLPFPELSFINLANNQLAEEEDLIALASWPMLNEVILYGNPIITKNVGYTPLVKNFLIDRLGINIQRFVIIEILKAKNKIFINFL